MKKTTKKSKFMLTGSIRLGLIFSLILTTVAIFGSNAGYAQSLQQSTSGSFAPAAPDVLNPNVTLSRSESNYVIPGTVACYNSTSMYTPTNTYWRAYNLAALGVTTDFTARSVTIGIETAAATAGSQTITVKLYTNTGAAFPGGTRTQISSNDFTVPNITAPTIMTFNLPTPVVVPAGTNELVFSVTSQDFSTTGNSFFIGSNAAGETASSYISAAGCSITTPTSYSAIGYPNVNIVLAVNGTVAGGTTSKALYDFDGDGKGDLSIFRPTTGEWYIQQSQDGAKGIVFGLSTDKLAPADYDGDGKFDIAVWRDEPSNPNRANFYILNSSDSTLRTEQFGRTGDDPSIVGDYDGDGKADPAVYRDGGAAGNQSYFFYRPSSQPGTDFVTLYWGTGGDKSVRGDFDGDGKLDAAVYRASDNNYYIRMSSTAQLKVDSFGNSTDKRVQADYDGDKKTDLAVYRSGAWYIKQSYNGKSVYVNYGTATDIPVPADYDGDGKTDVAVFRSGSWYINYSTRSFSGVAFGTAGDRPVPEKF